MKGLLRYLSPFAPDQSGASGVFYDLGGITVICDAGGCAGNVCGFDEPRWFLRKSAIFSAGLRDMDAILGRDDKLVEKLKLVTDRFQAPFAVLVGTPVPAVIATDFNALKRMAEKKCGLPILAVECTGTRLYDRGEEDAYRELFHAFAGKGCEQESTEQEIPGREIIGILGATPLNVSYTDWPDQVKAEMPDKTVWFYGMGDGLETVKHVGQVSKNLVVAPSALKTAKYLERTFGVPYEVAYPALPIRACDHKETLAGKKILIIHQQVLANAMRADIRRTLGKESGEITCASFFMSVPSLREDGDLHLETETELRDLVTNEQYDMILADPLFKRPLGDFAGEWLPVIHYAVSGNLLL